MTLRASVWQKIQQQQQQQQQQQILFKTQGDNRRSLVIVY